MSTELKNITESQSLVSHELNNQILAVLSSKVEGFEKAFIMASAIQVLQEKLTPEFMKPILALQGSNLGFKTDKDKNGGYTEHQVKSCLIDAVLLGLQPTNNEFNIISGNMYPTRQGFGSLLQKIQGLKYNLVYSNPIFSQDKSTATCKVTVSWDYNMEKQSQELEFPIKSNEYTTADAILGKCERKARRWLFNTVKGTDIPDGDVTEIPQATPKPSTEEVSKNKQYERVLEHITVSNDIAELIKCEPAIRDIDTDLISEYAYKFIELAISYDELFNFKFADLISEEIDFELFVTYSDKLKQLKKAK
jgi:hypothetical protein